MCGISVILKLRACDRSKDQNSQVNGATGPNDAARAKLEKELDDSLEMIKHRGPDSRGQWISPDRHVGTEANAPLLTVLWRSETLTSHAA